MKRSLIVIKKNEFSISCQPDNKQINFMFAPSGPFKATLKFTNIYIGDTKYNEEIWQYECQVQYATTMNEDQVMTANAVKGYVDQQLPSIFAQKNHTHSDLEQKITDLQTRIEALEGKTQ